MKNNKRTLEVVQKLVDILIIQISWWSAYFLRFYSGLFPNIEAPYLPRYLNFSLLLVALSYIFLTRANLYSSKRITTLFEDIIKTIKTNALIVSTLFFLGYFLAEEKPSRILAVSFILSSTILLILTKVIYRKTLKPFRKKVVLVGDSKQLHEYVQKIQSNPSLRIEILNWFKDEKEIETLNIEKIQIFNPDSIIFGMRNQNSHLCVNLLNELNNYFYEVIVFPDLSHTFVGNQIVNLSGITAIVVNEPGLSNRGLIIKRIFDITSCSIGVLLISPLLLLIAILVKLTSKGPILYSQVRMGLDGKEFKMYKFRSMRTDSTNKETWTVKDDPRVTTIGKFIRKTSIDELPQLFNVILGDMSLVGPRPERPMYVNQFKNEIPAYMLRHKMKAGITGWAQINGWRGDTSISKRIECDLYYIRNWSLGLDIWIILMTFWKGFINKNAY